eukprot:6195365-Pleurochrysis_carterae.AAC.2
MAGRLLGDLEGALGCGHARLHEFGQRRHDVARALRQAHRLLHLRVHKKEGSSGIERSLAVDDRIQKSAFVYVNARKPAQEQIGRRTRHVDGPIAARTRKAGALRLGHVGPDARFVIRECEMAARRAPPSARP